MMAKQMAPSTVHLLAVGHLLLIIVATVDAARPPMSTSKFSAFSLRPDRKLPNPGNGQHNGGGSGDAPDAVGAPWNADNKRSIQ